MAEKVTDELLLETLRAMEAKVTALAASIAELRVMQQETLDMLAAWRPPEIALRTKPPSP